jgi:hypothetical protein
LADLAAMRTAVPRPGRHRGRGPALSSWRPRGDRNLEIDAVIRDEIEALVARERPGWRVVEVVEINDESGPSFEVTVERGHERRTVLVSTDERIVGERR